MSPRKEADGIFYDREQDGTVDEFDGECETCPWIKETTSGMLEDEERCGSPRDEEIHYFPEDGDCLWDTVDVAPKLKSCLRRQRHSRQGSFQRLTQYLQHVLLMPSDPELPAKKVEFDSLSIREYLVVEGDHPYCRRPPALALGWEVAHDTPDIPLDLYEEMRAPLSPVKDECDSTHANSILEPIIRLPRRHRRKLRLSSAVRREWLGQSNGETPHEWENHCRMPQLEEEEDYGDKTLLTCVQIKRANHTPCSLEMKDTILKKGEMKGKILDENGFVVPTRYGTRRADTYPAHLLDTCQASSTSLKTYIM